jgi:hypothetical protein
MFVEFKQLKIVFQTCLNFILKSSRLGEQGATTVELTLLGNLHFCCIVGLLIWISLSQPNPTAHLLLYAVALFGRRGALP